MNTSIYSLAYLQYTYEVLRKDILDLYVPMFCKCLLQDKACEVDLKRIKEAMNAIYGIDNITYGAIRSICDRMASRKYGILEKRNGVFYVIKGKLNGYQLTLNKDDKIIDDFNILIKNISDFSYLKISDIIYIIFWVFLHFSKPTIILRRCVGNVFIDLLTNI